MNYVLPIARVVPFTILSGETRSEAIDCRGLRPAAWQLDAWDTADLSFVGCDTVDGTFLPIYIGNTEQTEVVVTDSVQVVPVTHSYHGVSFVKVRSGKVAGEVAQGGPKASVAITVNTGKVMTFTSGVGGPAANAITITIEVADDDTLAVTNPEGTSNILIQLAKTTGSKNAEGAIQTAIRALTTVGGVDVSAFVASGDAAYDAAPPTTILGTIADVPLTGGDDTHGLLFLVG